jgi:peptide/nickel transport system ATP-binding protein
MVLAASREADGHDHTLEAQDTGILAVRGLTKTFGSGRHAVHAVDNIDLIIREGEVVAIIGESGSGKTTTGRMLLGLMQPTSGSILFDGVELSDFRKQYGMARYWSSVQAIFQDPFASFNGFYSVRRCMYNAFKLFKTKPSREEREARIREAIASVGLDVDDMLSKHPHQLSGGQRQRLMIARALVIKPRVLIADEPTSMIDASSRASILNIMLELRERLGVTILFITHDIGMAYYTSDRLFIMNKGKIVETGTADAIIQNPQHAYTQRLLADVPTLHKDWIL